MYVIAQQCTVGDRTKQSNAASKPAKRANRCIDTSNQYPTVIVDARSEHTVWRLKRRDEPTVCIDDLNATVSDVGNDQIAGALVDRNRVRQTELPILEAVPAELANEFAFGRKHLKKASQS